MQYVLTSLPVDISFMKIMSMKFDLNALNSVNRALLLWNVH